ncbi:MAG TPA: glycosyltransferase family 1 protein [Patescibacteria group bacterium]|nr:glycosyltransferase family 1 protein [Patescibacteria group bacterium]
MRIGIDCRTILNPDAGEKAGIAHYTYHLVKNLLALARTDEFVLFFDHRARGIAPQFLEPNSIIRFFSFSRYKKYLPFVYSHILSASTIAEEKLDLFHSPANVVPFRYGGKFVVTIHDLAIYREPNMFPSRQGFSIRYLVPRSIQRAERIIAVSESTKRDVIEFFKLPKEKVVRIYEGVDHDRFIGVGSDDAVAEHLKRTYGIKKKYILYVGTLEPRKNLIRLIEAYYQALQRGPSLMNQYQLVLAGSKGWLYEEIFEEVKSRNLEQHVMFLGYVPPGDLPNLYRLATVFVYPSIYEGFGLPVLEAMAAGTPVLTSSVSSLPELTGDAAVLVDPLDTEGMSEALEKLLKDTSFRASLAERGRRRAREFSWKKCATQTLQLYRDSIVD